MKEVFFIDTCRSPLGKRHLGQGIFHTVRADDLAYKILQEFVAGIHMNPEPVDDLYLVGKWLT